MDAPSSTAPPKTVFIVGAGASKEAGLPIGSELKDSIKTVLDIRFKRFYERVSGDGHIVESLRLAAAKDPTHTDLLSSLQHACWRIRDAMPQAMSIDNFMDVHSEDKQIELCGKLAIVRTILEAEANSTLFVAPLQGERQLEHDRLASTWFNRLFQRLTVNCKPADLKERLSSVVFIIFNYDRCIEQYLYYAFKNFYHSLTDSEVASLLRNLEIYHPYGTVGSIPWRREDDSVEYGATPNPEELLRLTSQIKTFTEGTDPALSEVIAIRSHMKTSLRLVFLGFAFHSLNIELLLPSGAEHLSPPGARRVFATAHGISSSDTENISADLATRGLLSARDIQMRNNFKCSELFEEYSRSLSFP